MENKKPFKTIDEQIGILRKRGMAVNEEDRLLLMREGYYSVVNGYKAPFIDPNATSKNGEDVFYEGVTFSMLYSLFDLDRLLKEQTFPVLVRAETMARTALAYCFSKYHPEMDSYLNPANYCAARQYHNRGMYCKDKEKLLAHLRKAHDNEWGHDAIDHYLSEHGHVPLWVLVNVLTFGNVSHMYSLSTTQVQNAVCKMIAEEQGIGHLSNERLRKSLSVLVGFRNVCAHDDRLYCARTGKHRESSYKEMLRALSLLVDARHVKMYKKAVTDVLHVFDSIPFVQEEVMGKMGIAFGDLA
jgi:abortive infection bacteriophage resistance protein